MSGDDAFTEVDVTDIVTEIVASDYWASGDDICIFITQQLASGGHDDTEDPSNYRTIYAWDDATHDPPYLDIEWSTTTFPLGTEYTCSPEVYFTNHHKPGQITYILAYDASAVNKYSANLLELDYTTQRPLFMSNAGAAFTPAANDIIYFGSCPLGTFDMTYGHFLQRRV